MKAFPSVEPIYRNDVIGVRENSGMDLRDYFAAKAMQLYVGNGNVNKEDVARVSYEYADAMMKARGK